MDQQTDYHSPWSYDGPPPPYHDGGHYNHHRRYQDAGEPPDSFGYNNGPAFAGRKRHFSNENAEDGCVKLYVSGVPREVNEEDVRSLFGEHGNITEVILFRDIKNLQQQEGCFVKYANIEDAAQAIKALHHQYTFPGKMRPIEVRYASNSRKQERPRWGPGPGLAPGSGPGNSNYIGTLCKNFMTLILMIPLFASVIGFFDTHINKVFVEFMNKHASKPEIAEIFAPYGYVKDVFLLFDETRRSCGRGYITFTDKSMAAAAIDGLNGKYVMKGCDQPLAVKFATPRRPKFGENRYGPYAIDPVPQNSLPNSSHRSPSVSSTCSVHTEPECDWSEHICPDGNSYYYNCITCESRWEKPEEYSFYEQQLENGTQQSNPQWTSW